MKNLDKATNVIGITLLFVVCVFCIVLTQYALQKHATIDKVGRILIAWSCFGGIVWLVRDTIAQIVRYIWHKVKHITFNRIVILVTWGAMIVVNILWVNEMARHHF